MAIRIHLEDVLKAQTDALLVTIDGARAGMEGNVARAFAKRWPEAYEEAEVKIAYPVALGRSVFCSIESECPFRALIFASTLHHVDVLPDHEKLRVNSSALQQAIGLAARHRLRSIAATVMTGGWRVSFQDSLRSMLATVGYLALADAQVNLMIHVRTASEYAQAIQVATGSGLVLD